MQAFLAEFDNLVHNYLSDLSKISVLCNSYFHKAWSVLITGIIQASSTIYQSRPLFEPLNTPGFYSLLKIDELPLLATRRQDAIERYGSKQVDKLFEQQLSLLMQSFGLLTIPAKSGERFIDLLCVSSYNEPRLSFLLEAKSSKHPYSLPTDDFRAIIEYIDTVRSCLASFPPARLVLIVVGIPSKTIASRIKSLETKASIPIRVITAKQLASLRNMLPGILPIDQFINCILKSENIISDETIKKIAKAYREDLNAHRIFVENILKSRQELE